MKYGIKEFIGEYREALGETVEEGTKKPSKPNLIELQRMAKQLRGTEKEWPLT